MIVHQNSNLPLSTGFFQRKRDPNFAQTLTFKDLNGTLFLQNADFHRIKMKFEDFNGTISWLNC